MNTFPISKAYKNFTELIRTVNENGSTIITKQGKKEFVMMKYAEYVKMKAARQSQGVWIKDSANTLIRATEKDDTVEIVSLYRTGGDQIEGYIIDKVPKGNFEISSGKSGLVLTIRGFDRTSSGGTLEEILGDPSPDAEAILHTLEEAVNEAKSIPEDQIEEGTLLR